MAHDMFRKLVAALMGTCVAVVYILSIGPPLN